MEPQNSTLINLINDFSDIKSKAVESKESQLCNSEDESETEEEIPIFIGSVPRYVSGISKKTSVSDVIKALIDDELANTKNCKQLISDPKHYTISERFQDIEHALEGDELIYYLWQNWGGRSDVQFRLKINKEKEKEINDNKAKPKKIKNTGIKKLLKKVLHQGEIIQKHLQDMSKDQCLDKLTEKESETSNLYELNDSIIPTCSKWSNQLDNEDDELFLLIDHHNDNDSGVFITKENIFYEMEDYERREFNSTPKRKFRYHRDFGSLKDHAINTFNPQENFTRASSKFTCIHKEIRSKMDDMKEIIEQEQSFLRKIDKYSFENNEMETDFEEFVDDKNEYCDINRTMIV